jgi:hypothetical protein
MKNIALGRWGVLSRGKKHWKTAGLVAACTLFMVSNGRHHLAVREFEALVSATADHGGGALFVMSPADCLATTEATSWIAGQLQAQGMAVTGLVIRDGIDDSSLGMVLEAANKRFRHIPISARTAQAFAGLTGTPVVLAISSSGTTVAMERVSFQTEMAASALVQRLLSAQGGGA